jgi:GH15 family glucan-1,4-alpha-glucosidase
VARPVMLGNGSLTVGLDENGLVHDFYYPYVNREIRIFFHQVFQISRGGRGDTALYVPEGNYVLDYKGRCALLVYSQIASGTAMDQFSVGNYGIEGKEGTWRDAEDGDLSDNPVEHGGVDSTVRCALSVAPQSSEVVDYWVIAADSQFSAEKIHTQLLASGLTAPLAAPGTHCCTVNTANWPSRKMKRPLWYTCWVNITKPAKMTSLWKACIARLCSRPPIL